MLVNAEFHKRFANTYVSFADPQAMVGLMKPTGLTKTTIEVTRDLLWSSQRSWLVDLS